MYPKRHDYEIISGKKYMFFMWDYVGFYSVKFDRKVLMLLVLISSCPNTISTEH